jgi:Histones H3 and H4
MVELPLSPVGRIIKNEGSLRISDATESSIKVLKAKGEEIDVESVELPKHAKKQ